VSFETTPYVIEDFSGGLTDNYLDGVPNRYRYGVNFLVTPNKKLYTRPGWDVYNSTYYQIPPGNVRVGAIVTYLTTPLVQSGKNFYHVTSSWQTLVGPSSNPVLNVGDTTAYISSTFWNGHLFVVNDAYATPQKIFADGAGALQVRDAGLPALATAPTVTAGIAGAGSYIYAFHYSYTYTVGSVTFEDSGSVKYVSLASSGTPTAAAIVITAIPALVNSTSHNWATSTIKVKIYRTTDAGSVFFYVGQVTNGTTTFNDSVSDATAQANNITLYTTDGSLDCELPPPCKYMHVVNGVNWMGAFFENSQELKNSFQPSFPNNPDGTSTSFRDQTDQEITGISSVEDTPLIFTKNPIYRIDGRYERDGSGGFTKQIISSFAGCISNNSIVKTEKGTFWAGNDGFYWTDGFNVMNIATEFTQRYKAFAVNTPEKIYGAYDSKKDLVYWAVSETGTENDTIYVAHLKFGIKPDTCFTTWSGDVIEDSRETTWAADTNFAPTCLIFFNNELVRGDTRGYILKHSDLYYYDILIDIATTPDEWVKKPIRYFYASTATDFGTTMVRKWVTRMLVTASNETKLSLGIISINDAGRKTLPLKPIIFKDSVSWGEEDLTWGDGSITWGADGVIEQMRRFPATGIRCSRKQIVFTNAYVEIENSTASGPVASSFAAKTVTLSSANAEWPINVVGTYISLSGDNYTREFEVLERTSDTVLTVDDPLSFLPTGSYGWKLRGYPVGQILNLLSYLVEFALIGKTQTPYRPQS